MSTAPASFGAVVCIDLKKQTKNNTLVNLRTTNSSGRSYKLYSKRNKIRASNTPKWQASRVPAQPINVDILQRVTVEHLSAAAAPQTTFTDVCRILSFIASPAGVTRPSLPIASYYCGSHGHHVKSASGCASIAGARPSESTAGPLLAHNRALAPPRLRRALSPWWA